MQHSTAKKMSINKEITESIQKVYTDSQVIIKTDVDCSHYMLIIVTNELENLSLLKKHQAIMKIVSPYLKEAIHAIHLKIFTPTQWSEQKKHII